MARRAVTGSRRATASLQPVEDVEARGGLDDGARLADGQREGGLLELREHLVPLEPAEVAAQLFNQSVTPLEIREVAQRSQSSRSSKSDTGKSAADSLNDLLARKTIDADELLPGRSGSSTWPETRAQDVDLPARISVNDHGGERLLQTLLMPWQTGSGELRQPRYYGPPCAWLDRKWTVLFEE